MNIPHDQFCVLPWVSLEASPIGTVRPCCLAEDEIVDDNGNKFELISAEFSSVQNSHYMRDLRQQFLDQKQPKTCCKCWSEELSGRTSKRMHTLERLKHMIPDQSWTLDARPLMFLDLKLGNICNLKCRICGSWSSSQFAAEELHLMHPGAKKRSIHYEMLKKGAWPRENPKFWQQVDDLLDQIRYIEFTGGEPFMIQQHFDMLQGIVDRGIAHQVEIHYNTNGTHYPAQAEEIWRHFRVVEIAISIDDVGARFEYQRTNAVWREVCENIESFRRLRSRSKNVKLQVCSTVNVFNIFYLETLAKWIDRQEFDYIYWNMLHEILYFNVASLPRKAKDMAIHRLETATVRDFHRCEFDKIVDFVNNGESLDGGLLRTKIADLDLKRNTNLMTDHPDLARAIDYDNSN